MQTGRILITLGPSDKALLEFLQLTIEFFISFTNQVHNLIYRNRFDVKGESVVPVDDVRITITNTQVDTFYTDEMLSVEIFDNVY